MLSDRLLDFQVVITSYKCTVAIVREVELKTGDILYKKRVDENTVSRVKMLVL